MKQITLFTLFISYFLGTTLLKGQNLMPQIIPPSPNATALAMYSDYPVSHFTGVPDINIPLYEIKIGDYTLPISLSYHASGIMVGQEASNVGLGWVLNAGGAISRTVRCYDDFGGEGYCITGYFKSPDISTNFNDATYFETSITGSGPILRLKRDAEPDIFYCNIPGFSSKFVIGQDKKPHFFNLSQHVALEYHESGLSFTVCTADGVKYIFSQDHREKTTTSTATAGDNWHEPIYRSNITTTWYLSEIVLPNNRSIKFRYRNHPYESPTYCSYINESLLNYKGYYCAGQTTYKNTIKTKTDVDGWELAEISWDHGSISFSSTDREDMLHSRKLDWITIKNSSGEQIKSFNFEYDYFNPNIGNTDSEKSNKRRLKLTRLWEYGTRDNKRISKPYEFLYFEGTLPEKTSSKTDMFGYYNGEINHGSTVKQAYVKNSFRYLYNTANYLYFDGASKESSFDHLKIGTLRKIIYPTGGFAEFQYEENSFVVNDETKDLFISSELIYSTPIGVSSIYNEEYEDKSKTIDIRLNYAQELVLIYYFYDESTAIEDEIRKRIGMPLAKVWNASNQVVATVTFPDDMYYQKYNSFTKQYYPALKEGDRTKRFQLPAGNYRIEFLTPPPENTYITWQVHYDKDSYYPKHTGGGLRIANIKTDATERLFSYSPGTLITVPEFFYFQTMSTPYCEGNVHTGGTALYFVQVSNSTRPLTSFTTGSPIGYYNVSEYLTQNGSKSETKYSFYCEQESRMITFNYGGFTGSSPFAPNQPVFENGLLERQEFYNSGKLIRAIDYSYGNIYETTSPIYGYFKNGPDDYQRYAYQLYGIKNTSKITYDYFYNNNNSIGEEVETVIRHSYNNNTYQLEKTTTYDSENNELIEQTKYPSDYTDAVSKAMVDKHMLNKPVEQITLKNGKVINAQKTQYANMQGIYLPEKIFATNLNQSVPVSTYTNHYTQEVVFERYDEKGNIIQVRGKDGVPITYIWSYNKQYPVMEFLNATYDEVIVKLGNEITSIESDPASILSKQASLYNSLASMLPNTKMRLFTYKPLVGMTSVTDEKGITIYYEYDDAGRLIQTKDNEGKTQQSFEYHYQNN
jgi:YD repeat-containing protein